MARIKLSRGKFAEVDDSMFEELNQWKWSLLKTRSNEYAVRVVSKNYKQTMIMMHRYVIKAKSGELVDHKNRNTLDNRESNLRVCNSKQNCGNRLMRGSKTSKYKGVHLHRGKKWAAAITKNYVATNLGLYDTEDEAALAYNKAAKEHFGEFALLNVIK